VGRSVSCSILFLYPNVELANELGLGHNSHPFSLIFALSVRMRHKPLSVSFPYAPNHPSRRQISTLANYQIRLQQILGMCCILHTPSHSAPSPSDCCRISCGKGEGLGSTPTSDMRGSIILSGPQHERCVQLPSEKASTLEKDRRTAQRRTQVKTPCQSELSRRYSRRALVIFAKESDSAALQNFFTSLFTVAVRVACLRHQCGIARDFRVRSTATLSHSAATSAF
jgi:hypothetical protein